MIAEKSNIDPTAKFDIENILFKLVDEVIKIDQLTISSQCQMQQISNDSSQLPANEHNKRKRRNAIHPKSDEAQIATECGVLCNFEAFNMQSKPSDDDDDRSSSSSANNDIEKTKCKRRKE